MARIFRERKCNADHVLSYGDFKLYSDMASTAFVPDKAERIVKRAEEHLAVTVPILPATLFLEFLKNGNRSNFESICFKRRTMLLDLAIAEAHERKGRFINKLVDILWATLEESTWVLPAHMSNFPTHNEFGLPAAFGEGRLHGVDIFSAPTAANIALIYDLLREELDTVSPVITEKIKYTLRDRIIKPYLNCQFWWTGENGSTPNNWCPWSTSNILFVTAVIEDDLYTRKRVVSKALRSLDCFTAGYPDDGGCDEGPGYWGGAGASYFDCLEILYDMTGGDINVYDHPLVKAIGEYIVKFNIDGARRFINFADCAPSCTHDGALIRRFGEKCGSEMLAAFGDTMNEVADLNMPRGHIYRAVKNLMTEKRCADKITADKKIWFPDLKVMIARESSNPKRGMFVAMKGGNNNESHNHNDVGNVVVYYNGNPVLIDTGAGRYTKKTFSAQRYELWFMQSHYHNLPTFNGIGEMQGAAYRSADELYDSESGGVTMQLKNAYLPEADIISYKRSTVLEENGTVHITDDIELGSEKDIDFRFLTCAAPQITKDGSVLLTEGITMTASPALSIEIEEFPADDPGIENAWKSKVLWMIHFRTRAAKGKFEFTVK
ncbi:MAG: heparinase II/III family protein [Clostridia bacterium]|nr:heparinase II/III family protein [Clostridia bacterium]